MFKSLVVGSTILAGLGAIGCGSSDTHSVGSAAAGAPKFDPGPVPSGYARYDVPVIRNLEPGSDGMYCQWVAPPFDEAKNVLNVLGLQGQAGHHAALYANSKIEPVGTTRLCTDDDMLTVTFLGAIGGEGTAGPAVTLPDGLVFQMPPGQALMANTHYINTSQDPVDGHSTLDVKFAAPDPALIVAGSFALNYLGFQIPPQSEYSINVQCTVDQKVSLVMYANHMHRHGSRVFTDVKRVNGATELLSKDDTWTADGAFNPPFVRWPKDSPFVLSPGDTLHEQCTWRNTTSDTLLFPTEMCVGVGYALEGGAQYVCSATPM
jgi:hypothetical protein